MSYHRFNRQLSAAQRAYDNACPDDDDAIAERAAELTAERLADDARVLAAIEDALADDSDSVFAEALMRFFIGFDAAKSDPDMAHVGNMLFCDLKQYVEPAIRRDAETDAQAEFDRAADNAAEAAADRRAAA